MCRYLNPSGRFKGVMEVPDPYYGGAKGFELVRVYTLQTGILDVSLSNVYSCSGPLWYSWVAVDMQGPNAFYATPGGKRVVLVLGHVCVYSSRMLSEAEGRPYVRASPSLLCFSSHGRKVPVKP